jgi:hypothetical protein
MGGFTGSSESKLKNMMLCVYVEWESLFSKHLCRMFVDSQEFCMTVNPKMKAACSRGEYF